MRSDRPLNQLLAEVVAELDPILRDATPDLVLVQGDTTTALAAALAAHYRAIPVGHIEAGLRSGDAASPFPEETNRRLITRLAHYHFAATEHNLATLIGEGVRQDDIAVTGNPVVDTLESVIEATQPSPRMKALLTELRGRRIIVLTTHRRESFGETMKGNLRVLREFVVRREDVAVVFPVHPNPAVQRACSAASFQGRGIMPIEPLDYPDFLHLLWRQSRYRQYSSSDWIVFGLGYDKIAAFRAHVENFCNALRGHEPLRISTDDAVASVEVVQTAYESLDRGGWVAVPSTGHPEPVAAAPMFGVAG